MTAPAPTAAVGTAAVGTAAAGTAAVGTAALQTAAATAPAPTSSAFAVRAAAHSRRRAADPTDPVAAADRNRTAADALHGRTVARGRPVRRAGAALGAGAPHVPP